MSLPVLGPLVFLPFHLFQHHLIARCYPAKSVTYPLHLAFTVLQYLVEHFSAEFPTIASLNGLLVAIALSTGPLVFYCAYHRTTGPKSHVLAALAIFLVAVPVFKAFEFGFPKDDPAEQAQANLEVAHTWKHLVLHCVVVFMNVLTSYNVPWTPAKALTPSSEMLSTKPTSPMRKLVPEEECSPRGKVAGWGKTKAS